MPFTPLLYYSSYLPALKKAYYGKHCSKALWKHGKSTSEHFKLLWSITAAFVIKEPVTGILTSCGDHYQDQGHDLTVIFSSKLNLSLGKVVVREEITVTSQGPTSFLKQQSLKKMLHSLHPELTLRKCVELGLALILQTQLQCAPKTVKIIQIDTCVLNKVSLAFNIVFRFPFLKFFSWG